MEHSSELEELTVADSSVSSQGSLHILGSPFLQLLAPASALRFHYCNLYVDPCSSVLYNSDSMVLVHMGLVFVFSRGTPERRQI
jgi:hypothetical protein